MNPIIEDRAIVRGGLKCGQMLRDKHHHEIKCRFEGAVGEVVLTSYFDEDCWIAKHPRTYEELQRTYELDFPTPEPPKPGGAGGNDLCVCSDCIHDVPLKPKSKMVMLSPEQAEKVKELASEIVISKLTPCLGRETMRFNLNTAIDAITDKSGNMGKE